MGQGVMHESWHIQLVEGYPSLTFEFGRVSLKHILELTSTKHSDNIVTIHCAIHPLDVFFGHSFWIWFCLVPSSYMLGWEFFCCCKVSHMKHPNAGCAVILHSVPTVKLLPIVENHNAQIQLWFPLKQKGWQPLVVETLYFFAILFWLFHFFCGTIMLMLMLLSS